MKTLQLFASGIFIAFLTGCSDPNKPVQTATETSESAPMQQTEGATPVQADSVQASPNGPDQMIPENSSLTTLPKH